MKNKLLKLGAQLAEKLVEKNKRDAEKQQQLLKRAEQLQKDLEKKNS